MIEPTVGRIVLFHVAKNDVAQSAIVINPDPVNPRNVDVTVFYRHGGVGSYFGVPLLQDDDEPPPRGSYCEWMPFQKGQAAKTEGLQKQLDANKS